MKITDLKAPGIASPVTDWTYVKVETDQPGLYGWGEASIEWKTRAVGRPPRASNNSTSIAAAFWRRKNRGPCGDALHGCRAIQPPGSVANVAALHFSLSTPNFLIHEDMLEDVPCRLEVVQSQLKTENGYWLPCEAPGLGIEVDESAAAKHPFQQEIMQTVGSLAPDGAVLDW